MGRLKYDIKTEVNAPVIDWARYRILQDGGPGRTFIVLLDDDEYIKEELISREKTLKLEMTPPPSPRVKPRIQDLTSNITPTSTQSSSFRTRSPKKRSHPRGRSTTTPSRPSQAPNLVDASSDDDTSSSDESSSDESSSDESSDSTSEDASSFSGRCATDRDHSVFRPSRSPSRFPNTPSPTTRSKSHSRKHASIEPDPSVKSSRVTSSRKHSPLDFEILIPLTNKKATCKDSPQPHPSEPTQTQDVPSPATSFVRGWKPINNGKKHKEMSPKSTMPDTASRRSPESQQGRSTSCAPPSVTAAAAAPAPVPTPRPAGTNHNNASFRYVRAATAGPSRIVPRVIENHRQDQTPSPSPKGKGRARDETVPPDRSWSQDSARSQPRRWFNHKGKERAYSYQRGGYNNNYYNNNMNNNHRHSPYHQHMRHGPPRQARIERSIEETPSIKSQPLEPSSVDRNIPSFPRSSSRTVGARSETGMFVSSPVSPLTNRSPSSSRRDGTRTGTGTGTPMKTPAQTLPSPMASSPIQSGTKRRRGECGVSGPAGSGADPEGDEMWWNQRRLLMEQMWAEEKAQRDGVGQRVEEEGRRTTALGERVEEEARRTTALGERVEDHSRRLGETETRGEDMRRRLDNLERRLELSEQGRCRCNNQKQQQQQQQQQQQNNQQQTIPQQPQSRPQNNRHVEIPPQEFYTDLGARPNGYNPPTEPRADRIMGGSRNHHHPQGHFTGRRPLDPNPFRPSFRSVSNVRRNSRPPPDKGSSRQQNRSVQKPRGSGIYHIIYCNMYNRTYTKSV